MNILSNTSKTVIFKSDQGWFDRDHPNTFYSSRRAARAARRGRKGLTNISQIPMSTPVRKTTSLQDRARIRLRFLGVDDTDIEKIVPFFGYNASVSYGHMRVAGATHDEALEVIGYGFPDVSLEYGKKRQSGMNHADALLVAFDG